MSADHPLDRFDTRQRFEDIEPTGALRYDLFLLLCAEADDAERLRISHLIDAIRDAERQMGEELGSGYLPEAQAVLARWRDGHWDGVALAAWLQTGAAP